MPENRKETDMKLNQSASSKTVLTGVTGAAITLLVYVGQLFGFDVPVEIATAFVTVVAFAIAFFVPATSGKYVVTDPIGDPDPNDSLTGETYTDPEPVEITDPTDDSYVEIQREEVV